MRSARVECVPACVAAYLCFSSTSVPRKLIRSFLVFFLLPFLAEPTSLVITFEYGMAESLLSSRDLRQWSLLWLARY